MQTGRVHHFACGVDSFHSRPPPRQLYYTLEDCILKYPHGSTNGERVKKKTPHYGPSAIERYEPRWLKLGAKREANHHMDLGTVVTSH
ncbi:multi-sensor signal transduction histidine kinase [Anopheles sinensis]|uniref:Multi-sensor signal transduction histidine kinase n=1 Tax=Anopheles sinensis TaxID=74873 RepID=A0A084VRB6_ANOSI|nr:multi-sensor signal transduction histidine kinase [Anopheles sinensis]